MEAQPSVGDARSMSKRREAAFAEPALDGEVEVGERVTVLDLTTGAVSDYRIGEAGVSPGSPLGAALLGRHVGDVLDVALAGASTRLEIVEIDG
jgi:transcription elongation GreA/GreB family factor